MKLKSLKELLKDTDVKVITDPEKVYWHDLYPATVAYSQSIDIRQRGRRKPILLGLNGQVDMIIEWDWGYNQWIIHSEVGILGTTRTKGDAIELAYRELYKEYVRGLKKYVQDCN